MISYDMWRINSLISMDCRGIDPLNPFLWFTLSGIVLGIAVAMLIRRLLGKGRSKPVLTKVFTLISLAILLLLPPVIAGLGEQLLDMRLLVTLGGFSFISALGWTFHRAVGIPFLFIILIISFLIALELSQWNCAGPGDGLFTIEVLSREKDTLEFQIDIPGEDIKIGTGSISEPPYSVLLVEVADWYFFLPSRFFFRIMERDVSPGLKVLFRDWLPGITYSRHDLSNLLTLPLIEQEAFLLSPLGLEFHPAYSANFKSTNL
jgi:hypothetical protein